MSAKLVGVGVKSVEENTHEVKMKNIKQFTDLSITEVNQQIMTYIEEQEDTDKVCVVQLGSTFANLENLKRTTVDGIYTIIQKYNK